MPGGNRPAGGEGYADGGGAERDWLALPRALKSPIYDYLGFDITDGGEGWAEATLRIDDVLLNADGVLHGGMWMLVSDTAMGAAARTLIEPHERVVTSQSDFRWLRPLSGPVLRCVGRVVRRGRLAWHCSVECFDQGGALVGMGSGTFLVMDRDRPGSVVGQFDSDMCPASHVMRMKSVDGRFCDHDPKEAPYEL